MSSKSMYSAKMLCNKLSDRWSKCVILNYYVLSYVLLNDVLYISLTIMFDFVVYIFFCQSL